MNLPDNWLVNSVWRDGKYAISSYQYDSDDGFVFEYMCMLTFKIIGIYG